MVVTPYRTFFVAIAVFMAASISLVSCEADVNAGSDADDRKTNEDPMFIDFDDDSTTVSQGIEPLHLTIEPTPIILDQSQAEEVRRTVNDLVDAYMESTEDHTFRGVDLGPITGIQFRSPGGHSRRLRRSLTSPWSSLSSDSSRSLNSHSQRQSPATVLEISGGAVRYREETPSEESLKDLIQTAVNDHFERVAPNVLRSSGLLVEGLNIQRISLTWESEGYTLAPSPSPSPPKVRPDSDSEDGGDNGNGNGNGNDDKPARNPNTAITDETVQPRSNSAVQYSIFTGMIALITVIVALFLAKRRRQLSHFRRDKVEGSGIEYVKSATDPDEGAFPAFSPNDPIPIVPIRGPPKNPADIEIAIPHGRQAESDISSLSSHGAGAGRSRPLQNSHTHLSLNRVNNNDMFLGTSEGFDFLGGPEKYPVYNPFATTLGKPTRLLGPTGESLWYSSSSASEDTSLQFDVNKHWNPDDNHDDDDHENEAKAEDELLSPPIPILPKQAQAVRPQDSTSKRNEKFMDHGFCENSAFDDQSSLGLRSIT